MTRKKEETDIGIKLFLALLWVILAVYLLSLPVNAEETVIDVNSLSDDMKEYALCNEVTDIE